LAAAAVRQLYAACRLAPPVVLTAPDAPAFVRLLAATGARQVAGVALLLGLGSLVPGALALLARASGENDLSIQVLLLVLGIIVLLTAFGPLEGSEPTQARVRADRAAALLLTGTVATACAALTGSLLLGVAAFACLASLTGAARALVLANGGVPGRLGLALRTGAGLRALGGRPIDDLLARRLEPVPAGREDRAARPGVPLIDEPGWARLEELGRRRLDWARRERALVLGRLVPAQRRLLLASGRHGDPPPLLRAALAVSGLCEAAALLERVAVVLVPGEPASPAGLRWWRASRTPYAEALRLLGASPVWHALIALAPWRGLADRLLARLVAQDPDPGLRLEAIERIGCERFFEALRAPPVDRGPAGALFVTRSPLAPTALVRVEDTVRGADGMPHVHWLPVPPHVATAREAVAWTFGKNERDYRPVVET
jgi:hypothetical protein